MKFKTVPPAATKHAHPKITVPDGTSHGTSHDTSHGARRHQSRRQSVNMFVVALICLSPAKRLEAQTFCKSRNINTDVRILTELG